MADVTLIKDLVGRAEQCLGDIKSAQDDLKQIVEEAKQAQLSRSEIAAVKQIAKMRNDGKVGEAQRKLQALATISSAVGMDLFAWGASRPDTRQG